MRHGGRGRDHPGVRRGARQCSGPARDLEAAIAKQQDVVAEAFNEFKTAEILQRQRDARAAYERDRKEQIVLDEIAAINHARRQAEAAA